MNKLVEAYVQYVENIKIVKKPKMPSFDISAYTDNEYINAIDNVMKDYSNVDDFTITERFLKGD